MIVNIDGGSPWGFRLQGGGNFPLQVLKVRKRSKSHSHLIEGDIIIKVNGIPVQGKSHEAVMDMVDATVGPLLSLEIYRGESLHKIPKKAAVPTPLAAVSPASQTSTTSSVQMSEHAQHQHTTEESMFQKKISKQQMSQQSKSVLQQQQQQQQVAKSNIVLKSQVQPQQKVTQIQQSSQWQATSSQQQQQQIMQQQQKSQQHQQLMAEQKELAQQQFAEQQMARKQLAQQRQMAQKKYNISDQQSMQMMHNTSSSVQQSELVHEDQTTSVSTALWTSGQASSLDEKQTDLVHHAYTSAPKPYKPKVASHLPLRESPFTPTKPSPPPSSPSPAAPIPAPADDKENMAPSPVPKPQVPAPNVPHFNVTNLKNLVNQNWKEMDREDLNIPIPDYSKKITVPPRPAKESSPPVLKKTIKIPDMTIKPGPPVAPKPKRVLSEVQPEPDIPDNVLIPIYNEDRPHLPVFGPPVVYGLNPALAPKRSTSVGEEESVVSETSSGSRRNDPYYEAKKQNIYSDSSFYYDPKGVYPTIEEQMKLCKKISQSLTAAANSKARGATMFAKRQKRSIKWIHDGYSDGNVADLAELSSELDPSEGGIKPLFQFRIPKVAHQVSVESPPKMSLSREEFETLRLAKPKVDHTAVNPNTCMNIVADLQNSKGRGAKLFAKRQARCEKWVIDEKKAASAPTTPSEPPTSASSLTMMNSQNRLANMITKPMPIIQPKPAPKPSVPDPPVMNKHVGVPLPTVNADLQAEFKSNFVDGPNFNRKARGWKAAPTMPQSRPPRAQSLQPSSTKGPPPPVAPKPGKCMKSNPRPKLSMGDEQLPVHYRSSSDQLRLVSPGDPYHDASGYCSDVDHRTKAYAFKKPGMFRPTPYFAGPRMSQPVPYSLPGSDL